MVNTLTKVINTLLCDLIEEKRASERVCKRTYTVLAVGEINKIKVILRVINNLLIFLFETFSGILLNGYT
ncbi:hypothetical protein MYP_3216 [Sporocytophaga myxococcoides]|uniref:Uncharacterized protein n=1 Tax=Sporocytophaga myxococcoides TaxID=153721 RepID=A0A098LHT9_9BACT|nr:hypothetical protein MYP_3216 [Sporocytophaga myxococcoides]